MASFRQQRDAKSEATVDIRSETPRFATGDVAQLKGRVEQVAATLGVAIARVDVLVVGDAAMSAIHSRHGGPPDTTDVLTFAASGKGEPLQVDIVVCADEAARRAAEFGHGIGPELLLYVVHGLLHCMGHDDHDHQAFERMHAEEDRILSEVGIGPVFRPNPRPAPELPASGGTPTADAPTDPSLGRSVP